MNTELNPERQKIIQRLIHSPVLTFNELWAKDGPSNKFAYHIKSLEDDGIVLKSAEGYRLTHAGKRLAAYVEGETGKQARFPLVVVTIIVLDEAKGRFLLMERTKEPFYGYWGFPSGKLNYDQYILECAQDELREETGLTCDLELKGLFSSKTFTDAGLSYNHQMFVIRATNPRGTLVESTREGINRWFRKDEISQLKTFPNILEFLEIAEGDRFRWVQADRFQENDEFTGMSILSDQRI